MSSTQSNGTSSKDTWCFGKQSVTDAIEAVRNGQMVIVVDDEDRENEGDLIMAAEKATKETIAFMIKHTSGVICCAIEGERAVDLQLPQMVEKNEDAKCTAFTVSVDLRHGITTGISASDRAATLRALGSKESKASDFTRPGHIFPLRGVPGGVLSREGHTEASIDLSVLAGCTPAGVLCEIVTEDCSEMMRVPELKVFAKKHSLVFTSIQDLKMYRRSLDAAN
ncbi:hypothetical protein GUITHDRAFT_157268 [Guillardia theta CCMP2712]|uniref:3,4-dihydroxy-2-butanone 4-phosphate synthase n=1 Tax=Guillardia theta (strain CCMP2712) TaxID=905079 RepID=L1JQX0_GUITC|nr:hypothetical protein GUITHDRAFT_157268 [Guillardia theta CCMP2712]EKX50961.1 hypothetical protein GUITHDRAFT_157268 [Guillardia theta CCMP2712]|mmetsp:Transcript_9856/g.32969  ORF Transcript_9856/g.32969 Transcript_9856/m.32969 type:complete len:224 (-) Transcript_9856:159-830(-)|eukprot:XP_005837941.1 hypothetical protein GUITHDRAFT_157268 [Guillardia theta CCMP2712]